MGRKASIFTFLCKQTEAFISGEHSPKLDSTSISGELGIARYNVSRDLNRLAEEGKVLKLSGRPVCFLTKETLEQHIGSGLKMDAEWTLDKLRELLKEDSKNSLNDFPFTELIG